MRNEIGRVLLVVVVLLGGGGRGVAAQGGAGGGVVGADSARGFFLVQDIGVGLRGLGHVLTRPAHWSTTQWAVVPAGALALGALSGLDGPVRDWADRHHSRAANDVVAQVEPFGELRSLYVVVGAYAGGLALHRPGLRRTAVEAATASIAAGGIVTPLIKLAVGRARPRQHEGAYAFHGFSGDASFPSGHTTQAFAVASVLAAEAHPLWAKVAAYGLATGVAGSRIYHDAHFVTDVTAGALIGTVVGHSVVGYDDRIRLSAAPVGGGGAELGLVWRF